MPTRITAEEHEPYLDAFDTWQSYSVWFVVAFLVTGAANTVIWHQSADPRLPGRIMLGALVAFGVVYSTIDRWVQNAPARELRRC